MAEDSSETTGHSPNATLAADGDLTEQAASANILHRLQALEREMQRTKEQPPSSPVASILTGGTSQPSKCNEYK